MQEMKLYNKKDQIVMKLLHYFITQEGYSPIILQGAQDEIWLENQEKDYKIIRIASNYIHNEEQLHQDLFKTKSIIKNIKRKTFNITMNALSIFVNLGENVKLEPESDNHIDCVALENEKDISKYQFLYDYFPQIDKKMVFDEKGINLFIKITNDINEKNKKEAKKAESLFKNDKPIMTYILMAISIIVYIIELSPSMYNYILDNFAVYGAGIRLGEIYRLLTGTFIHGSIWHIFCNMYALYIIGPQIEGFFGKWKYLCIYLFSAITGSLLSILFSSSYSIGASGAIFGLLGAMLYFGYYYRVYLGNVVKSKILPIIILNLALGFILPNVDNGGHIGGLIGGILISMALGIKSENKKKDRINGILLSTLYVGFLIFMIFIYK